MAEWRTLEDAESDRAGEVFAEHRSFVESVAARFASTPADIPDIVQDVGVAICRGLNGFRGEAEIRTWLFRVTVNEARNQRRKHQKEINRPREKVGASAREEAVPHGLDDHVKQRELRLALSEGIQRLRCRPLTRRLLRDELTTGSVLLNKKTRFNALQRLRPILQSDPRIQAYGDDGGDGDGPDSSGECD